MTEEISLIITGYAADPAGGVAAVRTFDRSGRFRRAASGLALWWVVAVGGAFIPVAHFLLVPGFVVFGLVIFFRRLRTEHVILQLRGGCPDCGVDQVYDVPDRWAPPFELTCGHCGRGLKAKTDHGSS